MDWVAAGTVATAIMALGTFWMAQKTALSVQLLRDQLMYAYAPTFFISTEPHLQGSWPDLRVRNRGFGPAYDALVQLRSLNNKTVLHYEQKVDFWPTTHVVQFDFNAPDSVTIPTSRFCTGGDQPAEFELDIIYSDHLHQQYKASCPVKFYFNKQATSYELEYPKGKICNVQRIKKELVVVSI